MGRGDTFSFCQYTADNGNAYAIKLSFAVRVQGGFNIDADPNSVAVWPYGKRGLRHVYGKSSTGQRAVLPIATPSDSLYLSGGTFSLGGVNYTVQGREGQRLRLNRVA
jgi:hypothetical protein